MERFGIERDGWVLVHAEDGDPVGEGEVATSFRGERMVVVGGRPPHKAGSTGRIYVKEPGDEGAGVAEFFPGVCEMKWVRSSALAASEADALLAAARSMIVEAERLLREAREGS